METPGMTKSLSKSPMIGRKLSIAKPSAAVGELLPGIGNSPNPWHGANPQDASGLWR